MVVTEGLKLMDIGWGENVFRLDIAVVDHGKLNKIPDCCN